MPTFRMVTDLGDIARHNITLNALAKDAFPIEGEKAIFRAPHSDGLPHPILTGNGLHKALAWYGSLGRSGKKHVNLILLDARTEHDDEVSYEILLQINFPAVPRSRPAGRFLVEVPTGEIVLAHSGAITRRSRLPIAPVLERFQDELVTVTTGRASTTCIVIGRLSDDDLIDRICTFAKRMRAIANELGHANELAAREKLLASVQA